MQMLLYTFYTYMPALSRDNAPILAKSKQKQAELGETKRNTPAESHFVNSMHQLRSGCYVEGATWVPSSCLWQLDVEETAPNAGEKDKGAD